MDHGIELIERRIPDLVDTGHLPARLAAEIDFLAGRVDRWSAATREGTTPVLAARSLAWLGRDDEARASLARVDVGGLDPIDLAAAAWAASRVGGSTTTALKERLADESEEFLVDAVAVGPRRMYLGLLHAASGDLHRAIDELSAAVAVGDARAPLWGALGRLELGRVLLTAEAVPTHGTPPAAPVLTAARTYFAAGGYRSLLSRLDDAAAGVPALIDVARPASVGFGVQPVVQMRGGKGLVAVAHLVANRHRVVAAAELALVIEGADATTVDRANHRADQRATSEQMQHAALDDAARSRVSKLLRRTIAKVAESHRLLGEHLDASVTTGHGCRYRPAGSAVRWTGIDRPVGG